MAEPDELLGLLDWLVWLAWVAGLAKLAAMAQTSLHCFGSPELYVSSRFTCDSAARNKQWHRGALGVLDGCVFRRVGWDGRGGWFWLG